jgi:UDP-N-acetyl-D-mannosaminuronate dehydrogenase
MNGRDETVGMIGLGYVGLLLAVSFVESGVEVVGLDANPERVAPLQ